MTKPTKWVCAKRRLRSAWASAQSDQSLRCPHEERLGPYLPIKRTAETLIRQGECPGWSVFAWRTLILLVLSWGGSCRYLKSLIFEPPHDKTNKVRVRPAKTQIPLGMPPVWSESSLCVHWVAKDPRFLHADSEDSDQTGCPGWSESSLDTHAILLVLSWGG